MTWISSWQFQMLNSKQEPPFQEMDGKVSEQNSYFSWRRHSCCTYPQLRDLVLLCWPCMEHPLYFGVLLSPVGPIAKEGGRCSMISDFLPYQHWLKLFTYCKLLYCFCCTWALSTHWSISFWLVCCGNPVSWYKQQMISCLLALLILLYLFTGGARKLFCIWKQGNLNW